MVYNMAWKLGCSSPRASIMTFATSYVSLVYYTRTLSNTIEAFLFILLMNVVVSYWSAVSDGNITMKLFQINHETKRGEVTNSDNPEASTSSIHSDNQNHKDMGSKTKNRKSVERELTSKSNRSHEESLQNPKTIGDNSPRKIPNQMITMYTAVVALILVVGIFNRPTFPIFAAVPCILFMFCDRNHRQSFGRWLYICVFKIFKMSAWVSVGSMIIILCDSLYYGSISSADFDHLLENFNYIQTIAKKITVAPWNFVKYNMNAENLAQHGTHPYYQHLLVNTPLLFGILAVFPIVTLLTVMRESISKPQQESNKNSPHRKPPVTEFLISTYFVPILLLSFFPHQEPRFLIPLLCPIALLYGHHLFDIHFKWYIALFWVIFNIFLCGFFYGALHQGGLIPSIYEVRARILREPNANYHVVFSHTYMPPRHLFQIPDPGSGENNQIFLRDSKKFKHPEVEIHDMKGKPVRDVHQKISWIIQDKKPLENIRIFVIAPSSLDKHFCTEVNAGYVKIEYNLVMGFVPQITTEDPPDFMNDVFNCVNQSESRFCNWTCTNSVFDRLTFALSLNLYSAVIHAT